METPKPRGLDATNTAAIEADTVVETPGETSAPHAAPDDTLTPGTRLGRYVVLEEIGAGGMGLIFSAYDPELNRKVALKLLRPRHKEKRGSRSRLLQEAQALAKLAHPNVITVYDVGTLGDRVFVAMELVEGDTLRGWLRAKKRRWDEILQVFLPAGRGLAAAHAAELIHRDFKPENVLIGRDGRVRVMDFGLARPMRNDSSDEDIELSPGTSEAYDDEGAAHEGASDAQMNAPLLTVTGSVMGTPAYMAPEQHFGETADARSDQFSFCVALYQGLYGELPFDGDDASKQGASKAKGAVKEAPAGSNVPAWVRKAVLRGLQAKPEERFPTMEALLEELGKDPRAKRRKILTTFATGGFMIGGFAAVRALQGNETVCDESPREFAKVWNDERRAELRNGLAALDRPFMQATTAAVERSIDEYSKGWIEMHTEACEATHLRGEQSRRLLELRNMCLTERLDEIHSLVSLLAEGDARAAAHAARAAQEIGSITACADSEALAAAVDPPTTDKMKEAVAELRKRLARVKMLGALGHLQEGIELAEATYADARALVDDQSPEAAEAEPTPDDVLAGPLGEELAALRKGYPPVVAEARYRLGVLQGLRGELQEAETNLSESAWLAASVKHDAVAAAAAAALVPVVGLQIHRTEEGLSWARHAEAALKRIGLSGTFEALLRQDMARVYLVAGDAAKADEAITQALALYDTPVDPFILRLEAQRQQADVRRAQGQLDEADRILDAVTQSIAEQLHADHPFTAQVLRSKAAVAKKRGDMKAADALLTAAIDVTERAIDDRALDLVPYLVAHAELFEEQGQFDQALAQRQRVLELLRGTFGEHPRVARALHRVGTDLERAGRTSEARQSYDEALGIWQRTRGEQDTELAYALTSLGELDLREGQTQSAVERLEQALKLRGGRGLDPQLLAHTQFALARALHAAGGDQPRARELAAKAKETFAKGRVPDPKRAAEVDAWMSALSQPKGD